MRVVIDAVGMQSSSRTRGIGRYTRGLIEGMARSAGEHEIVVVLAHDARNAQAEAKALFQSLAPTVKVVAFHSLNAISCSEPTGSARRAASELLREQFLASLDADAIVFSSLFEGYIDDVATSNGDLLRQNLTASVLYDLIPLADSKSYLPQATHQEWYQGKLAALQRCSVLFAISDFVREEAIKLLKINGDRVVTVASAADAIGAIEAAEWAPLARRLGVTTPFFLYPATFELRKNFDTLIKAFGLLPKHLKASLVLATGDTPQIKAEIRRMASDAGVDDADIIISGHISDSELVSLYRNCLAVVYPSLNEGFGLPVLEAMLLDAPVIGAAATSIPEVIRAPAALFDPKDERALAAKMAQIQADQDFRLMLIENGKHQRSRYSWSATGARVWGALERLLATDGRIRRSRADQYRAFAEAVANGPARGLSASERIQVANAAAMNNDVARPFAHNAEGAQRVWRIEGPFDSTYSLALLNRETARALVDAGEQVQLISTEGPGDFAPDEEFLSRAHPDVLKLWREGTSRAACMTDIVSRNLYPPRVHDMSGAVRLLHHYAWEESRFPPAWVDQFNLHLDGATCLSTHVMKVLRDCGVAIPLSVSGCGVDHWERAQVGEAPAFKAKSFRFLHVSSCFPRKGADVLLRAYGDAFSARDDVTLVIKTFRNPHNEIEAMLAAARASRRDFPDVVLLFDELSDGQLKALYGSCDVLVAPSRAEGFALPIAEAMLTGLAVITTNWGGQLDFCDDKNAWLIDYDFAAAQTHFALSGSAWAEPKADHLAALMREARATPKMRRDEMAAAGRERLLAEHSWAGVAARLKTMAKTALSSRPSAPVVAWISTWNTRCGIASYSAHLLDSFAEEAKIFAPTNEELVGDEDENVERVWQKDILGASMVPLAAALDFAGVNTVVVQHNFGFHDPHEFNRFLLGQREAGRTLVVEMHSTIDPPPQEKRSIAMFADGLRAADRVLVHSIADLNRLKAHGMIENVALFPLGLIDGAEVEFAPRRRDRFEIASYGFCLPRKGLPNLLSAFEQLAAADPRVSLHLVNAQFNAEVSRTLVAELADRIARSAYRDRIRFNNNFLSDEQAINFLRAADLIVFPYEASGESASAAARFGIASGRPVAVTPLPIFDELKNATFTLPGVDAPDLVVGLRDIIRKLSEGGDEVKARARASAAWREEHSYGKLATRLSGLIRGLRQDG